MSGAPKLVQHRGYTHSSGREPGRRAGRQADPFTTAQRAAPISAALSLVMTLTGIASSRGCIRPFPTNAFMNNGPDNFASILGAMPPPR